LFDQTTIVANSNMLLRPRRGWGKHKSLCHSVSSLVKMDAARRQIGVLKGLCGCEVAHCLARNDNRGR
jgi:hypothetical protein